MRFTAAICALFLSCLAGSAQYYTLTCDSQNPTEQFVIDSVFSGNTPFLRSYHYDNGAAVDMTPWTMEFVYSYGQYDTNGVVQIRGVVSTAVDGTNTVTNCVSYLGATNVFFQAYDKYYFSIKGTHSSGYVKTFATGRMIQRYDPATDTNLITQMGAINMSWWTNNVGAQVESNRVRIAVFETGKVDRVAFDGTNVIFAARMTTIEAATNSLQGYITALQTSTGTLNTAMAAVQVSTGSLNTAIVALQVNTGTLNTAVAKLNVATGLFNTAIGSLQTSTGTLNTAVVALNASTNSLQTKVTALNTSTGSLNTAVASLQTSTGTINTAVAALQASTGALNTAVTALNTSTGSLNTAVTALNTSTGTLNTAVAGLQTSTGTLNTAVGALQTSTNALQTQVTALKAATNAIDTRVATLEGAGYLTSTTNIFTELYAANRSVLGANLSGLTQGVYTGALDSVAYTGVTELALGKTYAWGFTKIGSDGTATVSIASQSLSSTAAGLVTNHFTYTVADTNLILTLAGNGLAICNVSNLYVKQITNGNINAAGDVNVGGVMRVDGAVMVNPSVHIAATGTNVHGLGTASTNNTEDFYPAASGAADSNRAVAVEQQLGAAVTNLNTATNSLNTRADALETSTGTLNTAVATLNTATGALNSAVADLQISTGTLNTAVSALNTATGSLNSAVGTLNTATNSLNTRMGNAETSTTTLSTAVGLLNTATNSLNTRVTDLEGGGSAEGWSGYGATQQVFWTREVAVVTNIRVTGSSLTPAVQGDYLFAGAWNGTNYWACTNGFYIHINDNVTVFPANADWYIYNTLLTPPGQLPGDDAYFYRGDDPPTGDYTAGPSASGTPNAAYYIATNTTTWRAGPDPDDGQAWKLTLGGTNIYRAYAASNVFDKPIYGDGANISGVNATNAVTLAGLLASDYAKQANYAATSNLVDLTKSIADGLNSVSSMVNRVTTADYPATSNLVDSVKALADGLNSESNNWHVAYTSVFHGAGSTGRVTSEAGDATKFLKGDGTWSDTPAAAYGTTDSTAARGDWFAAVSGRVDNLITATQTLNTATNSLQSQININMPVGVILAYGASNAPTGWLLCDGAAVSRSTYAALFGVVGTTYGAGDESTTFNVPNLVERFLLGHTNLLGVASGTNQVTLTTNQIPQHVHQGPSGNLFLSTVSSGGTHDRPTSGNIAILSALTGPQLEPGGQSHTNMPPNLTVNYIIKH